MARGQYKKSESLFLRSLHLTEENLGSDSPALAMVLLPYAGLLRKTKRDHEAAALGARVKAIMQKTPEKHDGPPI
jgi:hypothetical protein